MEPISTPIVVLGMHRSGTSALTGMLHSLGIHLGPEEDLKSPQKDNPQGFWENNTLVAVSYTHLTLPTTPYV